MGVNLTHYKNKITSIPDQKKLKSYEGHSGYESGNYFYGEGLPMWTPFVYRSAGIDERSGEMIYYKWANRYDYTKPVYQKDAAGNNVIGTDGKPVQAIDNWGEPIYEDARVTTTDANGNTVTTTVADRLTKTTTQSEASYFLGPSPHPTLYGGFNTRLSYAGFDLGLDFSFQLGGKILDKDYIYLVQGFAGGFGGGQVHKDALTKTWTPERRNATLPRVQTGDDLSYNNATYVDAYYVSASFLSLNNINFGYTVPAAFLHRYTKGQVKNLRLYVSADNVYYWSARKGLDPRQSVTGSTRTQYAPVRTISGGVTITF